MIFTSSPLKGALVLDLPAFTDERGLFVKTFHETMFRESGIEFTLRESYFSHSVKDVIRGMHFQLPPFQHSKIVSCLQGAILDVIVDLRKGSPTYGQYDAYELSPVNHKALYIPTGFAHGFKSLTDDAIIYYLVSSEYNREHDTGIHYDSFGFDWGVSAPVMSPRDRSFVALGEFDSPFVI